MYNDDDYEHDCADCGEPCDCGDTADYCDTCTYCYSQYNDDDY